ncbi:MAG: hypothetical protein K6G61_07930 [Solobacterium sp.]|nr:hypothetical protein [Solobacterium sp.]
MDPEEYHNSESLRLNNADTGTDAYGVMVSLCPNCGAEIISPDTSVTGFCSYCRAEVVMQKRMDGEKRPQYIIPLQITKEECKRQFMKSMHAPFIPKDFKDDRFLEGFRGFYIPYWLYDVRCRKTESAPEHTEKYLLRIADKLDGRTSTVLYDAAMHFDDRIANEIAPFRTEEVRPFAEEYLAGFYADRADVKAGVYKQDIETKAAEELKNSVTTSLLDSNEYNQRIRSGISELIRIDVEPYTALFPVWFLTWRRKDRVAYAVMNGQTGKITFNAPVDTKKMMLWIIILACILFFVFENIPPVLPKYVLAIVSNICSVILFLVRRETAKLYVSSFRTEDKAYTAGKTNVPDTGKILSSKAFRLLLVFIPAWLLIPIYGPSIICAVSAILSLFMFISITELSIPMHQVSVIIGTLLLLISEAAAYYISYMDYVESIYSFSGSGIVLAAALVTCFLIVHQCNLISTKPIPNYTNRKGGNNSAKND